MWLISGWWKLLLPVDWHFMACHKLGVRENLMIQFTICFRKTKARISIAKWRICGQLEPSQPLWEGRAWQLCSGSPLSKRREMLPVKIGSHLPREYFSLLFVFHCGKLSRRGANCKHRNYMQEVCNPHLDGVVEDRVEVTGGRTERRFLALPSTVEPGNRGEFSIEKEWPQKKML